MRPNGSFFPVLLFLLTAVLPAAFLPAQVLVHRSPSKVEMPPAATTPKKSESGTSSGRVVLAQGTNLQVEISRHEPMRIGAPIVGRLMEPVFVQDELAVPRNTLLRGAVVALKPDTKMRWQGRLRGDFTPFHTALVEFNQILLPGGPVAIATTGATSGIPVLRLKAPSVEPHRSLAGRYWNQAESQLHSSIAFFTAPGFGDRVLQTLYRQLPYHPQRIAAHSMWSFELAAPLTLPGSLPASPPPASSSALSPASTAVAGKPEIWPIHALLTAGLTSARARPGDPVQALVLEPVFDDRHNLAVSQGSILVGRVTSAKASRSFGRNGKLRFTFEQLRFPTGSGRAVPVESSLAGATGGSAQALSLDAEGGVTPRNQSSAVAPLLLTMLAGRAFDDDGNLTAQTGVASNGFGIIGRVAGLAAGNRNLAAGIGFYAAGLSFYENFLRRGHDVVFPKDTRIEIETAPLRAPVLRLENPPDSRQ